ncbi:flavodoxin FldB [Marinobacterium sedimentorum]|uniref:flavodoxin FldB n=1 Tax=Marinobacterium sedimentorum TaxID=2927804 RepID=UPI0020C63BD7|nr:flavodoxin FldB [Marinobacterium sedimentorum]MCP8688067.1 flavodoxin FldB [Marinobacterium sedimentorum]
MVAPIGLFYGSTTGNTAHVAERLLQLAGPGLIDLHDIADTALAAVDDYSCLIFGISTWDFGEQQLDWQDLWPQLDGLDLQGRVCALFGLGDQLGYSDWYLDAMGLLHERLQARGAHIVGAWPCTDDYDFRASLALSEDGRFFVGLALDEDSQRSETDQRLGRWLSQVLAAFGLSG